MTQAARVYDVLECDRRPTALGEVLYVRIHRVDGAPMGFREVYDVFADAYPGCYAVQVFPPVDRLFDQVNKYHLFVLDQKPAGLDLFDRAPKGTRAP